MASPEVWSDVRSRLESANLGVPIQWPNEQFDAPDGIYLHVDISGESADPFELTGGVWEETGTAWVEILVPSGTGITAALNLRKSVSLLFRSVVSGGLVYRGFFFDAGEPAEQFGNLYSLRLGIRYVYRDIPT